MSKCYRLLVIVKHNWSTMLEGVSHLLVQYAVQNALGWMKNFFWIGLLLCLFQKLSKIEKFGQATTLWMHSPVRQSWFTTISNQIGISHCREFLFCESFLFIWILSIISSRKGVWHFGSQFCFRLQVEQEDAPNLKDPFVKEFSPSPAQWLREAPVKGSTTLGASSHFSWRWKQNWLPKYNSLLRAEMIDKVQTKRIVSLRCVPSSEPYRVEFVSYILPNVTCPVWSMYHSKIQYLKCHYRAECIKNPSRQLCSSISKLCLYQGDLFFKSAC